MDSDPNERPRLRDLSWYFQPIFRSDGRTVDAFEALLRWPRPDGTVHGPADLLPALLHPEARDAFTRHTIVRLASLVAQVAIDRPDAPPLHLNLSPEQLMSAEGERWIRELRPDLRPRLRIELTEQTVNDVTGYAASVARLAASGSQVWLDDLDPSDLGARWPADLARAAIAGVKLDRASTEGLVAEPWGPAAAMVRRLSATGVEIVAEGIEDRSALPLLRSLGVRRFQGFGLGRPQPDLIQAMARFDRRAVAVTAPRLGA